MSFFRFCWKNEKIDWPKCARTIIPWDQSSSVHIDEIYTGLSWFMEHRTVRGVTYEELNHYTEIFVPRERHPAPKRILVYGHPGK